MRGHLLNDNLGGPGNDWRNLTPLTQDANNRSGDSMLHQFETPAKNAVDAGKTINFIVTASYGRPARDAGTLRANGLDRIAEIVEAEQHVPTSLNCQALELDEEGRPGKPVTPPRVIGNDIGSEDPEDYQLSPNPLRERVYLDDLAAAHDLTRLGALAEMDAQKAEQIVAARPSGGYRNSAQIRAAAGLTESQWDALVTTPGLRVMIFRRR